MHQLRAGLILSAGLAAASCGGSTTEPEDTLTGAEALALIEVAMGQTLELSDDALGGGDGPGMPGPLQLNLPCTMGGTVGLNAQVRPVGDLGGETGGIGMSVTLAHSGCVERHQMTGITFTLDGAPDLDVDIELLVSPQFAFQLSGTVDGAVRWSTDDGRRGTCAIDVALEPGDDPDALLSLDVTGQACGTQIMESFTTTGLLG